MPVALALLAATFVHADTKLVVFAKPGEVPLTAVTVTVESVDPVHALVLDLEPGRYVVSVDGERQQTAVTNERGYIECELERGGEITVQQDVPRPPDVEVRVEG